MTTNVSFARPPHETFLAVALAFTLCLNAFTAPATANVNATHGLNINALGSPGIGFALSSVGAVRKPESRTARSLALASLSGMKATRSQMALSGAIMRDYAPPSENWHAGHRGIDFASMPGEIVLSARAGQVGFAGVVGGKQVVTVKIGERTRITYEPVKSALTVGTYVTAGAPIGVVAPSEHSHCTAKCLHVGVRTNETYEDPWPHMSPWIPVRLLPPPH